MEPTDWNVVVAGAWNRAILTPAWIAEVVLGLAKDSTAEVLVPLDGFAPFQVRHQSLTVIPAPGQLMVQAQEPTAKNLELAKKAAHNAVENLSRTPLKACGVNIRYLAKEPSAVLLEKNRCRSEQLLTDAEYELRVRRRGETLTFKDGALNIVMDIPTTGQVTVTMNFDRQSSNNDEIRKWLSRPAEEYAAEAEKILKIIS